MKMFLKVVLIIIMTGVVLIGLLIFWFVDYADNQEIEREGFNRAITLVKDDESKVSSIVIRPDLAPWIKNITKKVTKIIYHEATIHNPKGDFFPDSIDDRFKALIKDKVQ